MNNKLAADNTEALGGVAQSIARARALLIKASPENLNYCESELASAIASLEALRQRLQSSGREESAGVRNAATQVRREVSEFADLLRQAREFHTGWAGLSEATLAGYTASGAPACLDRDHTRIALK